MVLWCRVIKDVLAIYIAVVGRIGIFSTYLVIERNISEKPCYKVIL